MHGIFSIIAEIKLSQDWDLFPRKHLCLALVALESLTELGHEVYCLGDLNWILESFGDHQFLKVVALVLQSGQFFNETTQVYLRDHCELKEIVCFSSGQNSSRNATLSFAYLSTTTAGGNDLQSLMILFFL